MKSFTFTLKTDCLKCGKTVGVNGPLRSLTCDKCFKIMKLTPAYWGEQVVCAEEGMRIFNYPYTCIPTKIKKPHCYDCEKPFSNFKTFIGKDTKIICKRCNKTMYTFPAPKWLKKVLPMAVQIISTARDSDKAARQASDIEVNEKSIKPIIFSCPNCSAALRIISESERITACEHCSSEIFIPDAIWNRLHPVKIICPWTIVYNGKKLKARE